MRVLIETANMTPDQWREWRNKGLGGSDCAAILGFNPWKSAFGVWLDKTGQAVKTEPSERMEIGTKLEDFVAQEFTERTGIKVRRRNAILQHDEHDWMIANVDRMIVGEEEGLECKVTNSFAKSEWSETKIPMHYELQCHHYMAVTGFKAWWIAALIGNETVFIKRIERDEEIINYIIQKEKEFWEEHVLAGKEPLPDGTKDVDEYIKVKYKDSIDEVINLPSTFDDLLKRRNEVRGLISTLESEKDTIEQRLKLKLKEFEAGESEFFYVTHKPIFSKRIDGKRLQKEEPELYENYLKESSYKRLTIKEK